MPAGALDKWSNMLYDAVTEVGANTLTFESVDLGVSLFDKVGLVVHRIEWYNWEAKLAAASDQIDFGLSTSNQFASATPAVSSIIFFHSMVIEDYGTAGNNILFKSPLVDDFSSMPGGGLLMTPKPLYLFVEGANLAAAANVKMRMFFTIVSLKDSEYFELLETRQFFG